MSTVTRPNALALVNAFAAARKNSAAQIADAIKILDIIDGAATLADLKAKIGALSSRESQSMTAFIDIIREYRAAREGVLAAAELAAVDADTIAPRVRSSLLSLIQAGEKASYATAARRAGVTLA